jgi:hypothetical protein
VSSQRKTEYSPTNNMVAILAAPPPTPFRLHIAARAKTTVKVIVGFIGSADLKSGNGPNHNVEKSNNEKTAKLLLNLLANTVLADKAAVKLNVDGNWEGMRGEAVVGIDL